MTADIRKAEIGDCAALARLSAEAFSQPMSDREFARELDVSFSHTLVACVCGVPVGFINIWLTGGNADLNNIAVSSDHRHKGIGQGLLDKALTLCEGLDTMTLEVRRSNAAAIAFYEKNGFEAVGTRKNFYERPVEDALIYILGEKK